MTLGEMVAGLASFYQMLILGYVLLSWIRPVDGLLGDIYRVLGTITEPWLGIFRRFIPPIGMMDVSPIVAILVLRWVVDSIVGLLS